jgi:hypothetical protein
MGRSLSNLQEKKTICTSTQAWFPTWQKGALEDILVETGGNVDKAEALIRAWDEGDVADDVYRTQKTETVRRVSLQPVNHILICQRHCNCLHLDDCFSSVLPPLELVFTRRFLIVPFDCGSLTFA